ncbi:putative DNA topoisomerase IB [Cafeteria roenbergensis virus]|uniref:DNA topoisomerase 1 n=1 Tax=Cafeteria roenbergensis virus (strain BV-PW1) TaxID=693272 RepID=E3T4S2_CROVB|nr:putative DNA topoisomerase IB [Cafeteria roenbergensis virus BV-PW1]ADO67185.1 putative DNA topoisomerase IB [Cafeteria roenbergensis virus BV-PW1]
MFVLVGGGSNQWTVFRHNGPMFPEEYIPHNIPIIVKGNKITLKPDIEEKLTAFAKYIDTAYYENPKFIKNFFNEIKPNFPDMSLNDFKEFDFSLIKKYLNEQKEKKLNKSKEEKEKIKEQMTELDKPYASLQIDGGEQKVGNFKIEPPGIFLGRGSHPKIGKWKRRIYPEDVILNLDKNAPIPKPHLYPNRKWNKIVHQTEAIWLATWKDEITGKNKYVFPSVESSFKADSDKEKFDLARKLKNKIGKIRTQFTEDMSSTDIVTRQYATALYLIDELAIRVGGKKDAKEEADTVGVTSLRVEHITLNNNNNVKLDFLGKDSVRFCKVFSVSDIVWNNLKEFTENKTKKTDIFDKITSNSLNNYLKSFMKDLSAKVWRTFKASTTFQKELNKVKTEDIKHFNESEKINYLLSKFNYANTQVALLCNHQKGISKSFDEQINKIKNQIKELRKKKTKAKTKEKQAQYTNKILLAKSKLETKTKMKNVSLGTSKTNYIDPRIIVSFAKRFNLSLDKLFTKTLLKRFEWATNVDGNYIF